jgi:hypothetical protein
MFLADCADERITMERQQNCAAMAKMIMNDHGDIQRVLQRLLQEIF